MDGVKEVLSDCLKIEPAIVNFLRIFQSVYGLQLEIGLGYIEETDNAFWVNLTGHWYDINDQKLDRPVARHFQKQKETQNY